MLHLENNIKRYVQSNDGYDITFAHSVDGDVQITNVQTPAYMLKRVYAKRKVDF